MERLRNIRAAVREIKETDPKSPIDERTVRALMRSGDIQSVVLRKRKYCVMESLEEYLQKKARLSVAALRRAEGTGLDMPTDTTSHKYCTSNQKEAQEKPSSSNTYFGNRR